jgi:hypothetical protein
MEDLEENPDDEEGPVMKQSQFKDDLKVKDDGSNDDISYRS